MAQPRGRSEQPLTTSNPEPWIETFAAIHADVLECGLANGVSLPKSLPGHGTMMHDLNARSSSGDLFSDSQSRPESYGQPRAGEGLLVLEAQQELLEFLVACCRKVFHNLSETGLIEESVKSQPRPTVGWYIGPPPEEIRELTRAFVLDRCQTPPHSPEGKNRSRRRARVKGRACSPGVKSRLDRRGLIAAPVRPEIVERGGPSQDGESKIPVNTRALKTLRALFHDPDPARSTSGEVDWKELKYAMKQAGFRAFPARRGSDWIFKSSKMGLKRVVHCHRPHSTSKLTRWQAREFGEKLDDKYGWSASTFILKTPAG